MSLVSIARRLPQELQLPMLEFAEVLEADLRAKLAVRREDFEALQTTVKELAEAQKRTEQRVEELAEAQKRTEQQVAELAEAQKRTEQRVEELAEAQRRSEERIGRLEVAMAELAEAQKRTEQRVEELAEAQKRTEQRLERLEGIVAELAEAQKRTEQRLERLEGIVAELAEAQKRTEQRLERLEGIVAELAEAQKRTEQRLQRLIEQVDRMQTRLDGVIGDNLERRYRERAHAYFGRVLRRVQAVSWFDIEEHLEKHLTEEELDDLRLLDLIVRGRPRDISLGDVLWLAVEVSKVVDRVDVERARRRADLLQQAGFPSIAVAAGEEATFGCDSAARDIGVVLVQDGSFRFWDEAVQWFRRKGVSNAEAE